MRADIKLYHHETPEFEKFVARIPVEMNIPMPHEQIPDHLDLQINQFSFHIPIGTLKQLVENALFIRGSMSNPEAITLKVSDDSSNVVPLREKIHG